jgi:hypothetical protein
MDGRDMQRLRPASGYSLVSLLMTVVILGGLAAVSVVGVSSMTGGGTTGVIGPVTMSTRPRPARTTSTARREQRGRGQRVERVQGVRRRSPHGEHVVRRDERRLVPGQVVGLDQCEPAPLRARDERHDQSRRPRGARRSWLAAHDERWRKPRADVRLQLVTPAMPEYSVRKASAGRRTHQRTEEARLLSAARPLVREPVVWAMWRDPK